MAKHYLNNKRFYEELKAYKARCAEAEALGEEEPMIPNYIGECIMLLSNRMSTKPSWRSYSYREEMVDDAIENCIMYAVKNFNPDKSKNPFGYFSLIIKRAFIRRLDREKKQQHVKDKVLRKHAVDIDLHDAGQGFWISRRAPNEVTEYQDQLVGERLVAFEDKIEKSKRRRKGL